MRRPLIHPVTPQRILPRTILPRTIARWILAGALMPACAHRRAAPPVITSANSPTAKADRPDKDLSKGGTENGSVEFALSGVTGALSVTLLALGGLQLKHAAEIDEYCSVPTTISRPGCTPLTGDPVVAAKISGGLSFFFAVPVAIASGFLLRRGLKTRRDAREWKAENPEFSTLRVSPWADRRGGGLGLRLNF